MNRGTAQTMIYRSESDRRVFLSILGGLEPDYEVRPIAYALMGNHYHVMFQSMTGRLSDAMQYLDGQYARLFNVRHDRTGALFQGRFRSERIDSDAQWHRTGIYIHLNPMRAGLEQQLGAWRWSSLSSYLAGRSALPWLHLDLLQGGRSGADYRAELTSHMSEVMALTGDPDPEEILWVRELDLHEALTTADKKRGCLVRRQRRSAL